MLTHFTIKRLIRLSIMYPSFTLNVDDLVREDSIDGSMECRIIEYLLTLYIKYITYSYDFVIDLYTYHIVNLFFFKQEISAHVYV